MQWIKCLTIEGLTIYGPTDPINDAGISNI